VWANLTNHQVVGEKEGGGAPWGAPIYFAGSFLLEPFLDLCVSSLRRGHANLLCIVPILSDFVRRRQRFGPARRRKLLNFSLLHYFPSLGVLVCQTKRPLRRLCNGALDGSEVRPIPHANHSARTCGRCFDRLKDCQRQGSNHDRSLDSKHCNGSSIR